MKTILKRTASFLMITFIAVITIIGIVGGGFEDRQERSPLNGGKPLIFAHKGIKNYYPENSEQGFVSSHRLGFSAIEVDVRKTKDDRMIVFHDRSARNLLGIDRQISELSFDSIKDYHLMYNGKPSSNKILTLDQLLKKFGNSMVIYLDIKDVNRIIADSVLKCLTKNDCLNRVVVADQNLLFLSYIKYKEPKVKTVLEGFYSYKSWLYYLIPRDFKPDYYASFLHEVDEDHIQFLNDNQLLEKKIVYGVNSSNIDDVYRLGLRHIILDYDSSMQIPTLEWNLAMKYKENNADKKL